MAECFVCVGNCAVFRGEFAERQAMEIHLACGGTRLLNMALEGWLMVGKVSCQHHHMLVCNVRDVGPGNKVAAWILRDLLLFLKGLSFLKGE